MSARNIENFIGFNLFDSGDEYSRHSESASWRMKNLIVM